MINSTLILKFLKFCVVGFSGMVLDFGVTWLCKEKFRWNKYRLWTFRSTSAEIPVEYGKFLIIAIIGLGINNLVIYLLHDKLKLNFYLSKLFAIGVVTLWNFTMNYFFTF